MASAPSLVSSLVFLAVVASSSALDTPAYVSSDRGSYELRTMTEATWWVETDTMTDGPSMGWRDSRDVFGKLFQYISGSNADNMKIPMTAPVLTKVEKMPNGQYKMTMMFYMSGAQQPPAPTNPDVRMVSFPQGTQFFVKQFNWFWASTRMYENNLQSLIAAIDNPALYDGSFSFRAGYENPMVPGWKRFETWLLAN